MSSDRVSLKSANSKWLKGTPSAAAVRAGDLLFVSGQAALDDAGRPISGTVKQQTKAAFGRIKSILKEAGGSLADVVDVMSFHKDMRQTGDVFDVALREFKADFPAWTALGMTGAQHPESDVVIRVIAHLGAGSKKCFTPRSLAWMRGLPMSGACRKGDYLFTSGLVSADSKGNVVSPGEHMAQARFCYDRLKEVLAAGGGGIENIVDMIAFNHDARGMDASVDAWCNGIIEGMPLGEVTSYTAIAMAGLLQQGQVGAYRAIADFSDGPRIAKNMPSVHWHKERIAGAAKMSGGRLIGISGQVASDGEKNIISRGDPASQARYCFSQISGVLEKHGASMDDIVEVISFHKDHRAWELVMEAGKDVFRPGHGPAWTPVGCTGLYLEGYLHEIYAIAMI
jgi:enamine deaminase RidA (YjgF/YER057c/UK114 family)